MGSTNTLLGGACSARWRMAMLALVALFVASMMAGPAASAQDGTEAPETPDVVVPGTGDEDQEEASPDGTPIDETTPDDATTPEATDQPSENQVATSGSGLLEINATDPGNPAVIAQGLAFLDGSRSVWQVRDVELGSDGSSDITSASLVYQVEGSSVIRNDVTGKRALLAPGEAFFKAGGDAYTTIASGSGARIWIFEVVGPNDVDDDAFYESPLIEDYAEGVFDMELIRFVLEPGETATVPDHTGPALVMSTNGDIDVTSGGLGLLATGDGQLITEDATVANNSSDPVEFVLAAFGDEVGDESSEPGTGTPSTEAASTEAATDGTTADETTDESTDETTETTPDTSGDEGTGSGQASINITALAEIYVVVVADGVTVFDGPIPQGGESGVIAGTSFDVYTSYGAGTMFTNACGEEFMMGYEEGEARYYLEADPSECAS